ncbi:P-selectin-like [Clavelina lepadiformis]|uniref:P-selectin-like n=1 Tax=Clavelina lepadiformis TaxID=159417 RepID=UPI00404320F7
MQLVRIGTALFLLCVSQALGTFFDFHYRRNCYPQKIRDGSYSPEYKSFRLGKIIKYSCNKGYELKGYSTIRCGFSGWIHKAPVCRRRTVVCRKPREPDNGFIKPRNEVTFAVNEKIWFKCDAGYKLDGEAKDLTCHSNGKWSHPDPKCVITCRDIGAPEFGDFSPKQDVYVRNNKVSFTCDEGYELVGSEEIRCRSTGRWTDDEPVCEITCGDIRAPEFGDFSPKQDVFMRNNKVSFTCDEGYELVGSEEIRCRSTGRWTDDEPVCEETKPAFCPDPVAPEFGDFQFPQAVYTPGDEVTFDCIDPYRLEGSKKLTCLTSGRWSDKFPSCELLACPKIEGFENGEFGPVLDSYPVGVVVWFGCSRPYTLQGPKDVECLENGDWSSDFPVCTGPRGCEVPVDPENGSFGPVQRSYPVGSEVTFSCSDGFELDGEEILACAGDGEWSDLFPTCEPITNIGCLKPPTPEFGSFIPEQDFYGVGDKVWYRCNSGYDTEDNKDIECQENGEWSELVITCDKRKSCRGKCYERYSSSKDCNCHPTCLRYRNCCHDFYSECLRHRYYEHDD